MAGVSPPLPGHNIIFRKPSMITKTGQNIIEKNAFGGGLLRAGSKLLSKGKSWLGGSSGTSFKATSGMKSSPFTTSSGSVTLGGGKSSMSKAKDMLSGAGTRAKWGLGGTMGGAAVIGGAGKAAPKKTRTATGPPNQMM